MGKWFLRSALGVPRYVWAIGVLAAIAAVWLWAARAEKADDEANQTIGAQGAVIEGQETTIEQVGKANDAGEEVRNDRGSARYDECLRSAAEGYTGFCERYRPIGAVPD